MKCHFLGLPSIIFLFIFGLHSYSRLYAQTVIGGTIPSGSAELEIQSTRRGFLPPRLTLAERNAIVEPATGLIIFNTTLSCIEMNVGSPSMPIWVCVSTAAGVTTYGGLGCSGLGSIQGSMFVGSPVDGVTMALYANVTWPGFWSLTSTQNGVTFSGSGNFTSPGCQLVTLAASGTPTAPGTHIWTTGSYPSGSAEGTVACLVTVSESSLLPIVPVNTVLPSITHTTTGATGIGSPSGLPPGVTAVWAANKITISGTPTASGAYNYSIPLLGNCGNVHAMGTITVLAGCQVSGAGGTTLTFSCYNLGAIATTEPYAPRWELNGDYYQWGSANIIVSGPTGPSNGDAKAGAISGWNTNPAPNGSWADGTKTANDPCPPGYRVPTAAQWEAVINLNLNPIQSYVGSWSSSGTNYSSGLRIGAGPNTGLFLPAAGVRDYGDGGLINRGNGGYYTSSTESGTRASGLGFSYGFAGMEGYFRTNGLSVRCIAE